MEFSVMTLHPYSLKNLHCPQLDLQHLSDKIFSYCEIIWLLVCMSSITLLISAPKTYSLLVIFSNTLFSAFCSPNDNWVLILSAIDTNEAWQRKIEVFHLFMLCVLVMVQRIIEKQNYPVLGRKCFKGCDIGEEKSSITQNLGQV